MKAFIGDLRQLTRDNDCYRAVVHTGAHSQLLTMMLLPGEATGDEAHTVDQFAYVVSGEAVIELDGSGHPAGKGHGVLIPAGTRHNIRNPSRDETVHFFVVSAPPHHPPRTTHRTQHDARQAAIDGKLR